MMATLKLTALLALMLKITISYCRRPPPVP